MVTVESIILFIYASFVRNAFLLPHQEGIFFYCFATASLVAQFVGRTTSGSSQETEEYEKRCNLSAYHNWDQQGCVTTKIWFCDCDLSRIIAEKAMRRHLPTRH
jgi:hypothetical protein